MKKYLMRGLAAMAFGGAFVSCSNDDMEFNGGIQQSIQQTYDEAFKTRFGEPAANQDWGFGTRANTRTENPKGNMWEAEGWKVPPVITNEQKDIVRQYFQQHPNLGYTDPQWTNFWVQQVYKGGTNTAGSQTPEIYTIGNGTKVTGGDNMDHLASKDANGTEDHINDFNNSDNNDFEGRMLMENSSTYSFGYNNSNGSVYHYDKAALVHWTVIRDWANAKGLDGNVLNDGWNRSYMGFDWEQVVGDEVYAGKGWWHDGFMDNDTYPTFEFEGKTYRYLNSNTNLYAYDEKEPTFHGKVNYNDKPSDDIIRQLLALGYLPYTDTQKDWIKVATGADGYYSDWIVTLTEAKKNDDSTPSTRTETEAIRVIAEDLTVDTNTDFDFNDVVFDVIWTKHYTNDELTSEVSVVLKAAGGTLPLYVDNKEVHDLYSQRDPTITRRTMVNTHAEDKGLNGKSGLPDITFTVSAWSGSTIREIANSISVYVTKTINGEEVDCPLTAPVGEVASKVAVGTDYDWCNERQDIDEKYSLSDGTSLFKEYVKGLRGETWYMEFNRR